MKEFIYLLFENIISIAITSLVVTMGYILTSLGNKLKKYVDDFRIKNYIEDVIKYINQAYENLNNEEKYNKAKKEITEWLVTENLRLNESKLKVLIESSVLKNKKKISFKIRKY